MMISSNAGKVQTFNLTICMTFTPSPCPRSISLRPLSAAKLGPRLPHPPSGPLPRFHRLRGNLVSSGATVTLGPNRSSENTTHNSRLPGLHGTPPEFWRRTVTDGADESVSSNTPLRRNDLISLFSNSAFSFPFPLNVTDYLTGRRAQPSSMRALCYRAPVPSAAHDPFLSF